MLNGQAPAGGAVVDFSSDSPSAMPPALATVPAELVRLDLIPTTWCRRTRGQHYRHLERHKHSIATNHHAARAACINRTQPCFCERDQQHLCNRDHGSACGY